MNKHLFVIFLTLSFSDIVAMGNTHATAHFLGKEESNEQEPEENKTTHQLIPVCALPVERKPVFYDYPGQAGEIPPSPKRTTNNLDLTDNAPSQLTVALAMTPPQSTQPSPELQRFKPSLAAAAHLGERDSK